MVDPSLLPDSEEHLGGVCTFWGIAADPAVENGQFNETFFSQEKANLKAGWRVFSTTNTYAARLFS